VPEYGLTFDELPEDLKNPISHRGRALKGARRVLKSLMEEEE
jgi:inosine/xanthosine triphosphate pyrophosphatase family protein